MAGTSKLVVFMPWGIQSTYGVHQAASLRRKRGTVFSIKEKKYSLCANPIKAQYRTIGSTLLLHAIYSPFSTKKVYTVTGPEDT